jgi:hypothetical protein
LPSGSLLPLRWAGRRWPPHPAPVVGCVLPSRALLPSAEQARSSLESTPRAGLSLRFARWRGRPWPPHPAGLGLPSCVFLWAGLVAVGVRTQGRDLPSCGSLPLHWVGVVVVIRTVVVGVCNHGWAGICPRAVWYPSAELSSSSSVPRGWPGSALARSTRQRWVPRANASIDTSAASSLCQRVVRHFGTGHAPPPLSSSLAFNPGGRFVLLSWRRGRGRISCRLVVVGLVGRGSLLVWFASSAVVRVGVENNKRSDVLRGLSASSLLLLPPRSPRRH